MGNATWPPLDYAGENHFDYDSEEEKEEFLGPYVRRGSEGYLVQSIPWEERERMVLDYVNDNSSDADDELPLAVLRKRSKNARSHQLE